MLSACPRRLAVAIASLLIVQVLCSHLGDANQILGSNQNQQPEQHEQQHVQQQQQQQQQQQSQGSQNQQQPAQQQQSGGSVQAAANVAVGESGSKYPHDVPPFDPQVQALPENQVAFAREAMRRDVDMYRNILKEAIDKRKIFGSSVMLILKFTPKILGNIIKNRRGDKKLSPRVEQKPEFFTMQADLAERVIDKSNQIHKAKVYTKQNVNTEELSHRANDIFDYFAQIIERSPVANYHRWDKMVLFHNQIDKTRHDLNFIDEAADLVAQFRAMGYENSVKVAGKIIDLLRKFAKGSLPSESEESS